MTRYIGKQPAFGNFVKLDAISVVNGQSAYTMQSGSSNFTNYDNVNQFIVSLNGVIQAPTDSFTVSGSTITFASALSTGDVINFILVLGDVLSVGTPSDNTVSTAKIQNTAVNADKLATDAVQTAKIQNDAVTTDKINLISTSSTPSLEAKGTSGQTDGYIQLNCEQNSHGIKLKSPPHSAGQSYTLTFPSTAPATDKFLQTNSSGVLSFADAGGGMFEHITTTTISDVAQVDFTSFSTDYTDFLVTGQSVRLATDAEILRVRVFIGGTISTTSHYAYVTHGYDNNSAHLDYNNGDNHIRFGDNIGNGSSGAECGSFEFTIYDVHSTSKYKNFISDYGGFNNSASPDAQRASAGGGVKSLSAITGIRFYQASGNIADGKMSLYGRKRS